MASFFGEVTNLESRAVDDDDCENESTYSLRTNLKEGLTLPTSCKLAIFPVGKLASSFVHCYILPENSNLLFSVSFHLDKYDDEFMIYSGGLNKINAKGTIVASVYLVNGDIIVCDISQRIPEDYVTELSTILLEKIQATQALVLMSQHMSTFKSENLLTSETSFLKSLVTSQFAKNISVSIPRLLPPNYISGFAAAILTEYEVKNKEAICIVNYVDTIELDSLNIQSFEGVLNESLAVKPPVNSDSTTKLMNYIRCHANQSNLYT